jgi:hypothetical protein
MNILWAAFRAAVNHAIDERNKEARRTRAIERGAAAAERIAEELTYWNDQTRAYETPKGNTP